MGFSCLVTSAPALAEDRAYVPYSNIDRGTEGVSPMALTIVNSAEGPISCKASLAHWYSSELGTAAPDDTIDVMLWHDPLIGELSLLNALEDRMPLEAIWCGRQGRINETRSRIALPFTAGQAQSTLHQACTDGQDGRLICLTDDD